MATKTKGPVVTFLTHQQIDRIQEALELLTEEAMEFLDHHVALGVKDECNEIVSLLVSSSKRKMSNDQRGVK